MSRFVFRSGAFHGFGASSGSGLQESAGVTQKCRDDGMVGGEVLSKVGAVIIRIGFFGAHSTL